MESRQEPPVRSKWATLLPLLLALYLAGCNPGTQSVSSLPPAPSGTLRIVSSFPLRGVDAAQSKQMNQAIDMALDERGATAGSWRIEHVALDDGDPESGDWSAPVEQENAQLAAGDPSVVAYVGPYNSGAVGVALPIANRAQLLVISPSATWPGLTQTGWNPGEPEIYYLTLPRNFGRLMPPDDAQAMAAADAARQDGVVSVLALHDGSSYSKGLAEAFVSRWRGMSLAAPQPIAVDPAANSLPEQVLNSDSRAIFYAPSSAGNAVKMARLLAAALRGLPVFATDTAFNDQVAAEAGDDLGNWHITFNGGVLPERDRSAAFSDAFQKAYGARPGRFAANAYDAANLVMDAVSKGVGNDRLKVVQAVLSTQGYEGAGGSITFDKQGDPTSWSAGVYRWQGNGFVLEKTITGNR